MTDLGLTTRKRAQCDNKKCKLSGYNSFFLSYSPKVRWSYDTIIIFLITSRLQTNILLCNHRL